MRLVTVRAPKGHGQKVAEIAFQAQIAQVAFHEAKALHANKTTSEQDVVQFETATPKAKKFIETLMDASFYNPETFSFTIRHPESIYASEPPEKETHPIVRPTTDVYEELWQFSKITPSLVGRVFLSSILLAFGMWEGFMPLIIAGLLFLPYHHHMLSMALGASIQEWRFFRQGLYAFLLTTLCIVAAGVVIGLIMEPHIKFTEFSSPPLTSFLLALAIGIAAGLGSIDDAGRRELIGLAATAHISVYPAWFGMKFIFGFDPSDKPIEFLWIFLMDVATLTLFAAITYKIMKMHGSGIRRFVKHMHHAHK